MRIFFMIPVILATTAMSTHASVLYDAHGFGAYDIGEMSSNDDWTVGVANPKPVIVDAGADNGNAMRIFGPLSSESAYSNNVLRFDGQTEGTMTVSFDMLTSTNFRSLNILVAQAGSTAGDVYANTTTSIAVGRVANAIDHYVDGAWTTVGSFELNTWQNVDIVIHLSGEHAGTFDFLVNGTPTATGVAWRNDFTPDADSAIGEIWFQGQGRNEAQGGGTTSRYTQIDNLKVTWVPEPASLGVLGLGSLLLLRRH